jgi:hypothetical protein
LTKEKIMSLYRKLLVHVLVVLMLFVGVSPVAAASATDHAVVPGTASFTVPAGQCPQLPAGISVSGEGESINIINTRTLKDGSAETRVTTVIKGTATDSNGGVHNFVYENSSVDVALPSGEHTISMVDTFVLNGPGPHYSVGFNWSWTYTNTVDFWPPVNNWVQTSTRGDVFGCDPL